MSLVNHNINNLSGGVSRQPEEMRYDNQVEEMENFIVTVAQGLRRRNPLNQVSTFSGVFQDNMKTHSYDRGDGLEKYGMFIDDNGLSVYDENGNEKVINIVGVNPINNWIGTDWSKDIEFLTVGDTTWLLNRDITVRTTGELTPNLFQDESVFYWVKRSFDNGQGGGYTYSVKLDGVNFSKNSVDSDSAISSLATSISSAGYNVKYSGSIMRISRSTPFTFEWSDSWGDQASFGWKGSVSKIEDLPSSMKGFSESDVGTITITGTDRDNFNNYYLKWKDGGYWSETVAENIEYKYDYKTLPAKLVRQSNGTFAFGYNIIDSNYDGFNTEWEERKCGDDDSNPLASFVNRKISNMFFYKNRLGFTSEENVILSEIGQYYNFFATTVIELLDSDPIDASVDSNTVSIIRNVSIANGSLTLWSDNGQFILSGGDILSPSTTKIAQTSSYESTNQLKPLAIDNEILFFNKVGDFLDVSAYSHMSLERDSSTAHSLTSHIPKYIPNTISRAITSSTHNLVFLQDSVDKNVLYVYKYYIHNQERKVSAWFKWTFSVLIKSITILNNMLYILADDNKILNIELEPKTIDSSFLDLGSIEYDSKVVMSRFNIETRQGSRIIREPFYIKNIKVNVDGKVDLDIINEERSSTKTVSYKHINRKLVIYGNSNKVNIGFSTRYNTGVQINAINIEGRIKTKSKNI